MGRFMEGWRRFRPLRLRNELESGLDEEIRFHIDRQTEKNLRAGMAPDEAHRQALIKFGGVDRARESTRDQFRFAFTEDILRDLRYGEGPQSPHVRKYPDAARLRTDPCRRRPELRLS